MGLLRMKRWLQLSASGIRMGGHGVKQSGSMFKRDQKRDQCQVNFRTSLQELCKYLRATGMQKVIRN